MVAVVRLIGDAIQVRLTMVLVGSSKQAVVAYWPSEAMKEEELRAEIRAALLLPPGVKSALLLLAHCTAAANASHCCCQHTADTLHCIALLTHCTVSHCWRTALQLRVARIGVADMVV